MNPTLTDILWYLAIGAFIVIMMRKGGCCGGHRHKEHKEHKEHKQESSENRIEHK